MSSRLFPALGKVDVERLPSEARRVLSTRRARVGGCPRQDAPCVVAASVWTPDEIALLAQSAARQAGAMAGAAMPDDGAAAQLRRELAGLNSILQVYGQGRPPRKPALDGPIDKPGDAFSSRVSTAVAISRIHAGAAMPVDGSVRLAVALLDVNDRDEAITLEPLDEGMNAPARAHATTIAWERYPFTAIVVLGNGPENLEEELSPRAKLRVRLAASRFAEKTAPFIIVTGGAVAPRGTRFIEAIEMRKALVERYGIPEHLIVVEPYARNTSTNLRNATRRLQAIGAPLERDAIVLTDADHSAYVEGPLFKDRSQSDLGYLPATIGRRLSENELAFKPVASSMRIDPIDPLDP